MEDFVITDPNARLQVASGAAAVNCFASGCGSGSGSGSAAESPDSLLSPLEIDCMNDIEKKLGSWMSQSDLAAPEPLQFGMELTDDEVDNAGADASRGNNKRKREPKTSRNRLSLYQVYSLEKNFKIENKLKLERKYELANELGLKPTQVTIWFQNRRARSKKNKDVDLNIDFDHVLKQYDTLRADHEKLLEENKRLKDEMKDMRHEMVIMKDSLLKYGKLMRAGLLAPQTVETKPGQVVKRTKQLQVGPGKAQAQVVNAQPLPQPQLVQTNNNHVQVNNVANEGVVAPQVQVEQHLVNSSASENSVFDSNSPLATAAQGAQLLPAPADYIPQLVVEPEPAENTNFIQADQQENSVNQGDTIDNPIHNLLDLDAQNDFLNNDDNNNQAGAPQTNPSSWEVNPMMEDDEAFWQFELR